MGFTKSTISQQYCTNSWDELCTQIKVLQTCQKNNNHNSKYGPLRYKEAEAISRDILLVDLIGPYEIRREGYDDPLILK